MDWASAILMYELSADVLYPLLVLVLGVFLVRGTNVIQQEPMR